LNAGNVPFRTKVLNDPAAYVRADGGVLYVERREFDKVRSAIAEVRDAIAPGLRPEVPMMTKRLADGVGLAEDPGGAVSFGQSRVHVVALGLWSCFVTGKTDLESRIGAVATQFAAQGLDAARPFLHAGGRDDYELGDRGRAGVAAGRRTR
ncbi:MAG: T3SS effector HopA1 family protein, partial [Actinomycetota bacterium]|nr:T3SS effector HopA1 family protein [Actinomycetota bacterium]